MERSFHSSTFLNSFNTERNDKICMEGICLCCFFCRDSLAPDKNSQDKTVCFSLQLKIASYDIDFSALETNFSAVLQG